MVIFYLLEASTSNGWELFLRIFPAILTAIITITLAVWGFRERHRERRRARDLTHIENVKSYFEYDRDPDYMKARGTVHNITKDDVKCLVEKLKEQGKPSEKPYIERQKARIDMETQSVFRGRATKQAFKELKINESLDNLKNQIALVILTYNTNALLWRNEYLPNWVFANTAARRVCTLFFERLEKYIDFRREDDKNEFYAIEFELLYLTIKLEDFDLTKDSEEDRKDYEKRKKEICERLDIEKHLRTK